MRHVEAPQARRGQAAAWSGLAAPPRVGADGSPAPADAGAPSDPKRVSTRRRFGRRGGPAREGAAPETRFPAPPPLPWSGPRPAQRPLGWLGAPKAYARSAQADNTQRPTPTDWKCSLPGCAARVFGRRRPIPSGRPLSRFQVERRGPELLVAPLERRLSGIAWRYRQLGEPLDISDRHIATVLAGIRRRHRRPPLQKAAIFADELLAMLAVLEMDLRGLRDRAILAIGFAGGLRRSEIVGLDCGPDETEDGSGWVRSSRRRPADHPRQDRLARGRDRPGSKPDTCPVALLETWMRLGRIVRGPVFRADRRKNGGVSAERLTDKHVVRLVKRRALAAGLRGELTEGERGRAFAATRCARASPPPRRSRRPTSRNTLATPAPK